MTLLLCLCTFNSGLRKMLYNKNRNQMKADDIKYENVNIKLYNIKYTKR